MVSERVDRHSQGRLDDVNASVPAVEAGAVQVCRVTGGNTTEVSAAAPGVTGVLSASSTAHIACRYQTDE